MKTGKIVDIDASTHQKVQKLLPWMLDDSLSGTERLMVHDHLLQCAECRADLDWQRQVQSAQPAMQAEPDVERAFAALSARLEPHKRARRPRQGISAWLQNAWNSLRPAPWQHWAMAAQCALIVGLGLVLLKSPADGPGQFHALSAADSAAAAGNVMVLFKPETPERELRRILQAHGAHIVDGPTVTDAYVLYLPPAGREAALAALRREPAVALAEALDGGAGR
ncbi:zf-HC2 domain-containing protein [Janthinobacterium sp. Mn2066]|uniref:zf-HC2 domain-containing protein n=1 Tax=Janthinobacterium sp. Mn2066 TaxID=3395264 RepID=UPI003BCC217A